MAEVYTISGHSLGAALPIGFDEKVQAVKDAMARAVAANAAAAAGGGARASIPRAVPIRLQNALKALGNLRGDPTLSKLAVDGIIGPNTVKAVNYAIAQKYVVMKDFPRPELTLQHVRQFSAGLAAAVEGAVKAGGGSFPLVPTSAPSRAKGGGGGVPMTLPEIPPPESDRKWVWWVVGGVGVLVALSLVARSVRGKPTSRRRPRDDDDED